MRVELAVVSDKTEKLVIRISVGEKVKKINVLFECVRSFIRHRCQPIVNLYMAWFL